MQQHILYKKPVNKLLVLLLGTDLVLGGSVENWGDLHILVCTKISQTSFWHRCWGLKKMNLSINILTKERIVNLDIFLYSIINFRKSQK